MSKQRRWLIRILVVGIALFSIPTRSFSVEFAPAKSYAVGTNPTAVASADFNGDGKPDIVVANAGSNNVSVLLGNGDGTFQAAATFDVGLAPAMVVVGDFNADGKMDIAVFQPGDNNAVAGMAAVLLGNGDGTFQAAKLTTLTISAANIAAGDFNGDNKMDLIVADDTGTVGLTLEILIGNGDGTFQPAKAIPTSVQSANLAVADFNKDGKLDLAITVSGGAQVLLGQGNGTFQAGGTVVVATGFIVNNILTADLNGDGETDLLVDSGEQVQVPCFPNPFNHSHSPCYSTVRRVSAFLANSNGTFGSELPFSPISYAVVAIGDFNGDGKTDAASGVDVRLGKGDGTFSPPLSFANAVGWTIAVDLNGDKLADLVGLDSANNQIVVYLNTSTSSGADLGIILNSADGTTIGEGINLTYSADVLNEGPQDATNVTFTDTLPNGVNFVSASSSVGNCTQSHLVVTCNVPSLASAADAQITIVVTPTSTGTITDKMSVSATETDPVPANNSATQTNTVVPVYTVTVSKTGNGSGTVKGAFQYPGGTFKISCGSSCSATFLSGATVSLSEIADSGSFFQSWTGACSGSSTCSLTMDSDKTVTATFVLGVTLTVKVAGGGTGTVTTSDNAIGCNQTGGTCSVLYAQGTSISLTAAPSGSSQFGAWSGACTGTDPNHCMVTMNSDESVTATFNPQPDFTVSPTTMSLSVKRGGQVSEALTFPAQGGFSGAIALTCSVSGIAPIPTCGISPNSVTPGSGATLTVNTAGLAATLAPQLLGQPANVYAAGLPFGGLILFLLTGGFDKKRRRAWLLCGALLTTITLPAACGGGSSTPPPPVSQNYTVTVTATSGAVQHSTSISVTVN